MRRVLELDRKIERGRAFKGGVRFKIFIVGRWVKFFY